MQISNRSKAGEHAKVGKLLTAGAGSGGALAQQLPIHAFEIRGFP
ncbi:hypothetical protein GJA_5307 [Janthinobacterium agaricidamnosum NBRC 102515 = DSM 9628]|uniref:Uncharacterized protein n=1 Tax=Janthinobacterium agaricidamnosum NBRC 102515 = DSM 9628 TaxID=1349767 RepID=W0VEQ9_9BURK|nr:hypothetical protein GJA_5307 [Janthinobacterium agaricidamnosum NBRC 102515 = DSM 9628]